MAMYDNDKMKGKSGRSLGVRQAKSKQLSAGKGKEAGMSSPKKSTMDKSPKRDYGRTRELKGVTIMAKRPKKYGTQMESIAGMGEVKKSKIDSVRKASPEINRAIGKGVRSSYGAMTKYSGDSADLLKKALNKNK